MTDKHLEEAVAGALLVSFATFFSWQALKAASCFDTPVRAAPFIILGISSLWAAPLPRTFLTGFAGAAGAAVLNAMTDAEGMEPWKWDDLPMQIKERLPAPQKLKRASKSAPRYVPAL